MKQYILEMVCPFDMCFREYSYVSYDSLGYFVTTLEAGGAAFSEISKGSNLLSQFDEVDPP